MILVPTCFAFKYHAQVKDYMSSQGVQPAPGPIADPSPDKGKDKDKAPDEVSQSGLSEPIAYQELYPDFYAPQSYHATEKASKTIYLTFDDGPSAVTDRVLATLASKDVKATFFVTGKTSDEDLARLKAIHDQGHTVGMHTFSHNYNAVYASVEAYLDDMYQIFTLIKEQTGEAPSLFRFPGGSVNGYNGAIYQEIIAEMIRRGFVPYDWNISSADASGTPQSADAIMDNVVTQASRVDRGIVLMHDSSTKRTSAEALSGIIDQLQAKGFTFERLTADTKPVLFGYTE